MEEASLDDYDATVKYLLAEGFIIPDGESYRYYTEQELKKILENIRKNGNKK